MKRAFTLIELIFTIVIMAGVFAVIPKILLMTNKSDSIALKQDALLQAVSMTNIASLLSWDEADTNTSDILHTDTNSNECNSTTHKRKGSYKSANGRVCEKVINASVIGSDGESSYMEYDDIDDFNGTSIDINTSSGKLKYKIYTTVEYIKDDSTIFSESGSDLSIDLSQASPSTTSTNIKKFKAKVGYVGRGRDYNITSFKYFSTNIGTFSLNSRSW